MQTKQMLRQLALRYLHDGPVRRRQDCETILGMCDSLDEASARVYLAQFVSKWRLAPDEERPVPLMRRRPMPELERRVYMELIAPTPSKPVEITVEGDQAEIERGEDGWVEPNSDLMA